MSYCLKIWISRMDAFVVGLLTHNIVKNKLLKLFVNCQMKTSNIIWNPHVATQLLLSSDNDLTPWAQVWDLRYATAPIKTLEGHQRGVLKTAWCAHDPNLLITAAKDSK